MTKWKTCAAVGGAVAALPLASNAAVITVAVNETVSVTDTPNTLDLTIAPTLGGTAINKNGGPDLTFTAGFSIPFEFNDVAGDNGSMYVVDSHGNPANLNSGIVGPGDTFSAGPGTLNFDLGGNFDKNGVPGYLGFEVPVTGGYDYGYVTLSAEIPIAGPNSITIDSYTYDNTGAPITTPETVPEPTTLALFAAGAVGLEAIRRRVKALKK